MIEFNSRIDNGYQFLSNFHVAPFQISMPTDRGLHAFTFQTVEGFYQVNKHPDPIPFDVLLSFSLMNGEEARRNGRTIPIVIDWKVRKNKIMAVGLRMKFSQHPDLLKRLQDTGNQTLLHVSPWDLYWGGTVDGKGQNMLGKMLMGIRDTK